MKTKYFLITLLYVLAFLSIFLSENIYIFCVRILGLSTRASVLLPLILTLITSITATVILIKARTLTKVYKIIAAITIPVIFLTCFSIVSPIYPEDFNNRPVIISPTDYPIDKLQKYSNSSVTCFFLISCPFCEKAASSLDAIYKNGGIKDIEIIYYAYQSTADSLVKTNNIGIPYSVISDDTFFNLAGKSFPTILLKKDDEMKFWIGNDVNYACFDYLISQ